MVPQKPQTKRFLTAAVRFLRDRNFSDCRASALRARDSDPSNPGPNRVLAITTALSAAPTDYYAVFGLPQFEPDASLIRSTFRTLVSNLNPNVNPYPIAAEAMDLVLKAWSVLSNPTEKAAFDEEIRRSLPASDVESSPCPPASDVGISPCMPASDVGISPCPPASDVGISPCPPASDVGISPCPPASDIGISPSPPASDVGISPSPPAGTFWTICPYCYHVYEYEAAYEDCSLRCSNEKCGKVLHAAPVQAPPPGVVEKGQYWCVGFMPLEISGSNGEKLGEEPWAPFGPLVISPSRRSDENVSSNGEEVIVDISDIERAKTKGKRRKLQEEAMVDISNKERDETNCKRRKLDVGVNTEIKDSNGVRVRRKKSVPWNSKKMMGRGVVVDENWADLVYGAGEEEAGSLNGSGLEVEFGGEESSGVEEFFEGDDDVFIGL